MADSPYKDFGTGVISYEVSVDGSPLPSDMYVQEIEVFKEINKIPYARIIIDDGDLAEQSFTKSGG